MTKISENHIEDWVIQTLQEKGYQYLTPDKLDPDVVDSLRERYNDVVLFDHTFEALVRINPSVSMGSLSTVVKDVERVNSQGDMVACNVYFQKLLTEGVDNSINPEEIVLSSGRGYLNTNTITILVNIESIHH